ncbi:hypothetical protein MBM09_02345 [Flaviramulus sp. BrNp1-15]|uniref:hypothetical protein n=1 Tax=Flaviramulus sp. BrNp1-15 TaxID=2916754 RepID=UPI001EE99D69|nr:hypothetical protein [Flaviramulus sp. BrNp1-15]ULC59829.1 hypothetical protein MBM09_02345 [Flaviramulus sp. BrNp1-15]
MNKSITILLLILTLVSCQKNIPRIDLSKELRGNTFLLTSKTDKDTLTIEFKDSTYNLYEYNDIDLPWRIASFENNDFLVFDRRLMPIKQIDINTYEGLLISEKDYEIRLEKKNPKWDKKLIFGTWVEEQYLKKDPINIPPPPPPLYLNEKDFKFPPSYEITKDSIYSNFYYNKTSSKIEISNLGEFISLNLNSYYDRDETLWKIKFLNDSLMILDRTIKIRHNSSYHIKTETDCKLIKKR